MSYLKWPHYRGDAAAFLEKHGEQRTERFQAAFYEGDPAADALFNSDRPTGTVMRQLRAALERGSAAADDAAEVSAFIADMTSGLDDVDWERLDRARRVYLSIPVLAHSVALGPGSLTNTYSSPAIASVLVSTGRLVKGAVRRLRDTRNWTYHLYLADALRPGQGGFEHTGMVRAMHAFSRSQYLDRIDGTDDYGLPINSVDMLRTWFDFTYVPYRGLEALGYSLSTEQIRDVYYFWRVVGRLLGIPTDLLTGLEDHDSAESMVQAIADVSGNPDENSSALVQALIHAFAEQMAHILQLPKEALVELAEAHIRIIHGDEKADQLHIPRRSIQIAELMQVPSIRQRYAFLQQLPHELEKEIVTNEATLKHILETTSDGQSAYETAPVAGVA